VKTTWHLAKYATLVKQPKQPKYTKTMQAGEFSHTIIPFFIDELSPVVPSAQAKVALWETTPQ
jgi:hypothetical protein